MEQPAAPEMLQPLGQQQLSDSETVPPAMTVTNGMSSSEPPRRQKSTPVPARGHGARSGKKVTEESPSRCHDAGAARSRQHFDCYHGTCRDR
eukprot:5903163-Pleurochrysis_carterae.AAC.5